MPDLAEVFFAQTKQRGAEKFRVAADVVIGMRVQLVAVFVAPFFFGLILPFEVDRARIPVVFFPRHVTAAFEDDNPFSGRGELVGERAATRAAAYDDDIVMIALRHVSSSESRCGG